MASSSSPTVGAYAVVRGDEPQVFLAEDATVISRVLAVHLVAQRPASDISSPARLREIRSALLEERWADALVAWIEESGIAVDVYEEAPKVFTAAELDVEAASMEIRMAPIFAEPSD